MRFILFAAGLTLVVAASSAAEARPRCDAEGHRSRAGCARHAHRIAPPIQAVTAAYAGDPRYAVNTSATCRTTPGQFRDRAGRLISAREQICE